MIHINHVRNMMQVTERAKVYEEHIDARIKQHALLGWPGAITVQLSHCDKATLEHLVAAYKAYQWNVTGRWNGTTQVPSILLALPEVATS